MVMPQNSIFFLEKGENGKKKKRQWKIVNKSPFHISYITVRFLIAFPGKADPVRNSNHLGYIYELLNFCNNSNNFNII